MGEAPLNTQFRSLAELRRVYLSVDAMHGIVERCTTTNVQALLRYPTGLGKTEVIVLYIASRRWKKLCSFVIVLLPSWQALNDFKARLLRANPSLTIACYERRDPNLCGTNDQAMQMLEEADLGELGKARICGSCPNAKGCSYRQCDSSKVGLTAEVVLVCDQRLNHNPYLIHNLYTQRLAHNPENCTGQPVVFIDECLSADNGFTTTITHRSIEKEIEAVKAAANLNSDDRSRVMDHLIAVLSDDHTANLTNKLIGRVSVDIMESGHRLFGRNYKPILRKVANYKFHRLWSSADRCAVQVKPWFPRTTVFVGAYLREIYLTNRYHLDIEPDVHGKGVLIRDPGTTVINIPTAIAFKKYRGGNLPTIYAFLADVITHRITIGQSTLLVGRKGEPAQAAKDYLEQALRERGHPVTVHLDPATLPMDANGNALPRPTDIGYVHYGRPGLNIFESFQAALFVHGPNVPKKAIADIIYADTLPEDRVPFTIVSKGGRHIRFQRPVDPRLQRFADAVLFRLEADPALQAFSRVRFGTLPRLVVMSVAHKMAGEIGRTNDFQGLDPVRPLAGVGTTQGCKEDRQLDQIRTLIAQGHSRSALAQALGVSERTISTRLKATDMALAEGRPPATRNRAKSHTIQ